MTIEQPTDKPQQQIKQHLERELSTIKFNLEAQKKQVKQFSASAPNDIRRSIQARKQRLKTHDGLAEFLGIPLTRRDDVPPVEPIPIKRKLVKPLPPPPDSGFKPEPGIMDEDFEHILSVIRHEGRTFEATPKTYTVHDEEELRDIMFAHLNGHYQGGATRNVSASR